MMGYRLTCFGLSLVIWCITNVADSCDLVLSEDEGSFTSPGHPSNYTNYANCTYLIDATDGKRISLEFTDFDVEIETGCPYDRVTVYDGGSRSSPVVGYYCGTISPSLPTSTGDKVLVEFTSDFSVRKPGFRAQYRAIDYSESCNLVLTDDEGDFTSPGHSFNYPTHTICTYLIHVSDGQKIELEFGEFELEEGVNCTYDSVKIYDGNGRNSPLVGVYCGTDSPHFVLSTGDALLIVFVSDYSVTRAGFTAAYTTVRESSSHEQECQDPTSMVNLISALNDSALSASSSKQYRTEVKSRLDPCRKTSLTRLCFNCGWHAGFDRAGEYIQVDLGAIYLIKRIVTKGSNNYIVYCDFTYVRSYKLLYSLNEQDDFKEVTNFQNGNKIFHGNGGPEMAAVNNLAGPFWARFVRLELVAWNTWPALRWELSGCKITESVAGVTLEGVWGEWGDWGTCDTTCGSGYEYQTRPCLNPSNETERVVCGGHGTQARPCDLGPCPIHGGWNHWANWGDCSVTCESGQETRVRTCTKPEPQHGGDDCVGEANETRSCIRVECPMPASQYPRTKLTVCCANTWGEWKDYVYCPEGQIVSAFKLQVHKQGTGGFAAGNDDTALNNIMLRCEKTTGNFWEGRTEIMAHEGLFGDWTEWIVCSGSSYMYGFELRSEKRQGRGDDTAANDFNAICKDAITGEKHIAEGHAVTTWGDWYVSNECAPGGFVCGIRTKFEEYVGFMIGQDDTTLNDVELVCCPYPY